MFQDLSVNMARSFNRSKSSNEVNPAGSTLTTILARRLLSSGIHQVASVFRPLSSASTDVGQLHGGSVELVDVCDAGLDG